MKRRILTKALIILAACTMLLCACRQDPEPIPDEITFKSEIPIVMTGTKVEITNTYKTDYFRGDACIMDKDLALLSFAQARCDISANLTAMRFDNLEKYENTGSNSEANKCTYCFGHRSVDGYDLIVVALEFIDYDIEWAGNFTIGEKEADKRSDHNGFDIATEWVYGNLKEYIDKNYRDSKLKFWITGYSRGGDLVNVLACKIIERNEFNVKQSDMYAYAFEASSVIDADYVHEYQCIHNIVVDSDIIAAIPPAIEDWGLARPGSVVYINGDYDTINKGLKELAGDEVSMPVFTAEEGKYSTSAEFLTFFVNMLAETGLPPVEDAASFRSRESFFGTIQSRLTYLLKLLMKDNRKVLGIMTEELKAYYDEYGAIGLLELLVEDALYEFTKPILEKNNIEFVDAELKDGCSLFTSLAVNENLIVPLTAFLLDTSSSTYIDEAHLNNLKYIVLSHFPEVVYVLVKNYAGK